MKGLQKILKTLGMAGVGLCALCCALPSIGIMLGIGAFVTTTKYLEWTALAALAAATFVSAFLYIRKVQSRSCDIYCGCNGQRGEVGVIEKELPKRGALKDKPRTKKHAPGEAHTESDEKSQSEN